VTDIVQLIILALIKIFDNILMTIKSIATNKNKKILSSILVIINQYMFYFIIKQIQSDSSVLTISVISIFSGVGTLLAFGISDRFSKDAIYTNVLTCSNREDITQLCDYLTKHKIKQVVTPCYTRKWEDTYSVMVFSKTKQESKLIDEYLNNTETKYLREIISKE
jgi:hypothetical protein